jgi:heat shock protein HslJ
MKKTIIAIVGLVVIGFLAVVVSGIYKFNFTNGGDVVGGPSSNVKNLTYTVDGQTFTLINGKVSMDVAPGSSAQQTLQIFGEPVYGDLNGDGVANDAALLLVNNAGGSGAFYYAVLALNTNGVYKATNSLLLGDRIAPQTVEIHDGRAVFNYAERKANEPMTTQPSIGKSLWVHYDVKTGEIGELAQGFEGEANPSTMSLGMKKWEWVKTEMNDGAVTTPKKSGVFSLTFATDGNVKISTDCNAMSGKYSVKGNTLLITQMLSTKMFCEGSQELEFSKTLGSIASFLFTSKGELILEVKMDSGVMVFR